MTPRRPAVARPKSRVSHNGPPRAASPGLPRCQAFENRSSQIGSLSLKRSRSKDGEGKPELRHKAHRSGEAATRFNDLGRLVGLVEEETALDFAGAINRVPGSSGTGTVLAFTNVTAFRASLDQAIYDREFTKTILNTVAEALLVLDSDLRIQTANQAFHAFFGVTREAARGIRLAEVGMGSFDLPSLRSHLQETLGNGRTLPPFEVVLDVPGTGHRTVAVTAAQLSLPSHAGPMILVGLQDITERKQAEGANARLAAIVGSSHDAIVSKDLNGIITSWNSGAERLFGYTAEEVIGKSIAILIPADRHNEEPGILERIRRGERVEHYETTRLRKDGTLVEISLTVSPVKDASGKVVGASKIARDISERKQAQARQELLAHEIHHRTKNPFAVVQAVVSRSFAGKRSVKEAETAVLDRLHSLAQTHVMLIEKEWQGADIGEVVRAEMSPYAGRVTIEGPSLKSTAKAAQNFALALHELATNAAKYGALSNSTGHVRISWLLFKPNGTRLFAFRWQERGGPQVTPPTRKGFGSAVLEQVMAEYFEIPPQIEFARDGVSYELTGSLDAITAEGEQR